MVFDYNCEEFGAILGDYRNKSGKTLEALGTDINVSKATISRWENNQISKILDFQLLMNIAEVLEIGGKPFNPNTPEVSRFVKAYICSLIKNRLSKDPNLIKCLELLKSFDDYSRVETSTIYALSMLMLDSLPKQIPDKEDEEDKKDDEDKKVEDKKSKKTLTIAVLFIAAVIGIIVLAWVFFMRG